MNSGEANLGAGLPTSKEALDAYAKWVTAMVTRYQDKVKDWEVWNEPNFGDNTINTPEMTAEFNIRTAEIIKKIQPNAKISGIVVDHSYHGAKRFGLKKGFSKQTPLVHYDPIRRSLPRGAYHCGNRRFAQLPCFFAGAFASAKSRQTVEEQTQR